MKKNYIIAAGIILAGLSPALSADFYQSNFGSMGTIGTTPPLGWSVLILPGDSSNLVIPTGPEMAAAIAPGNALAIWNQTDPVAEFLDQAANVGSTPTNPNRLLGSNPTQDRGTILQLSLNNNSGAPVDTISIAYNMLAMANGVNKPQYPNATHEELPGYSFYYLDGSTWTHAASLDLSNDTLNSLGQAFATIHLSTPVANGGNVQFRWFDDNSLYYAPDFTFAIDNVIVNIPEPGTLSLLAVGALAFISRRRLV